MTLKYRTKLPYYLLLSFLFLFWRFHLHLYPPPPHNETDMEPTLRFRGLTQLNTHIQCVVPNMAVSAPQGMSGCHGLTGQSFNYYHVCNIKQLLMNNLIHSPPSRALQWNQIPQIPSSPCCPPHQYSGGLVVTIQWGLSSKTIFLMVGNFSQLNPLFNSMLR